MWIGTWKSSPSSRSTFWQCFLAAAALRDAYDTLWTARRVRRVAEAAVKHGVAWRSAAA